MLPCIVRYHVILSDGFANPVVRKQSGIPLNAALENIT